MASRRPLRYPESVLSVPLPFPLEEASPTARLRVVRDLWGATPPQPLVREAVAQPEVERLLGCPLEHPPFSRALPPLLALLRGDPSPFVDPRQPFAPAHDPQLSEQPPAGRAQRAE